MFLRSDQTRTSRWHGRRLAFGIVTSLVGTRWSSRCLQARSSPSAGRRIRAGGPVMPALAIASAIGMPLVTNRIVFASIAFAGDRLDAVRSSSACWSRRSGRYCPHSQSDGRQPASAIDSWLVPLPFHRMGGCPRRSGESRAHQKAPASATDDVRLGLPPEASSSLSWFLAFGYPGLSCGRTANDSQSWQRVCCHLRASAGSVRRAESSRNDEAFNARIRARSYVAVDPSYRIIRHQSVCRAGQVLRASGQTAYSARERESVSIDFDASLTPSHDEAALFLFVVDSCARLRVAVREGRVYRPSASLRKAVMFDRAFTRYGGADSQFRRSGRAECCCTNNA